MAEYIDSQKYCNKVLHSKKYEIELGRKKRKLIITISRNEEPTFQVLKFILTDEEDVSFWYTFELNDEDYEQFKTENSLTSDFTNFASEVILLLEKCKKCESSKERVRYNLVAVEIANKIQFKIMEINGLKSINLVELNFLQASVEEIKQKAIITISKLKATNKKLTETYQLERKYDHKKIVELEHKLAEAEKRFEARLKDIKKLHKDEKKVMNKECEEERAKLRRDYERREKNLREEFNVMKVASEADKKKFLEKKNEWQQSERHLMHELGAAVLQVENLARKLKHLESVEHDRCQKLKQNSEQIAVLKVRVSNADQRHVRNFDKIQKLTEDNTILKQTNEIIQCDNQQKNKQLLKSQQQFQIRSVENCLLKNATDKLQKCNKKYSDKIQKLQTKCEVLEKEIEVAQQHLKDKDAKTQNICKKCWKRILDEHYALKDMSVQTETGISNAVRLASTDFATSAEENNLNAKDKTEPGSTSNIDIALHPESKSRTDDYCPYSHKLCHKNPQKKKS